ncbi:hypothetical protein [Pectobacterium parmentieri]|nr:hypothetical protein [Pectobacterium parmentieri]ACX88043.1 hypothetical protein Pecwa_2273 [Pectobacterium parmentieri WPP163]QQA74074.1 hypothetical protein JBL47_11525 [Pectobacterium parmentieri]
MKEVANKMALSRVYTNSEDVSFFTNKYRGIRVIVEKKAYKKAMIV